MGKERVENIGAMRQELLGEMYSIGAGGLTPVKTGKMTMMAQAMYPMGASTSPKTILMTRVTKDKLYYKDYPWTKETQERMIDRRIGEDLIFRGTEMFLKHGGRGEMAKSLRSMLKGGKGKKENLADLEQVTFLLTPAKDPKEDLWRQAERYGSVGGMTDPESGREYYEVNATVRELNKAKKDKAFKIVKVEKGRVRIGLPEGEEYDLQDALEITEDDRGELAEGIEALTGRKATAVLKKAGIKARSKYSELGTEVRVSASDYRKALGILRREFNYPGIGWEGTSRGPDWVLSPVEIRHAKAKRKELKMLGWERVEGYDPKGQHARLSKRKAPDAGRASKAAAMKLEGFFKDMGFKVEILQTNGWGMTPMIVEMYGIRVPIHVGVQETPKATEMFVQFQAPMMGGREIWREISPSISSAMKKVLTKFGKYGKATLPRNEKKWPTIWVKVKEGKETEAIRAFPSLVHSLGYSVSVELLADEAGFSTVNEDVMSEARGKPRFLVVRPAMYDTEKEKGDYIILSVHTDERKADAALAKEKRNLAKAGYGRSSSPVIKVAPSGKKFKKWQGLSANDMLRGVLVSQNTLIKAETLGRKAFKDGKKAIPVQDKEVMKLVKGHSGGASAILGSWMRGWNDENIKAPMPEDVSLDEGSARSVQIAVDKAANKLEKMFKGTSIVGMAVRGGAEAWLTVKNKKVSPARFEGAAKKVTGAHWQYGKEASMPGSMVFKTTDYLGESAELDEALPPVSDAKLKAGLRSGKYKHVGTSDAPGPIKRYHIIRDPEGGGDMQYPDVKRYRWLRRYDEQANPMLAMRAELMGESNPVEKYQKKTAKKYVDGIMAAPWTKGISKGGLKFLVKMAFDDPIVGAVFMAKSEKDMKEKLKTLRGIRGAYTAGRAEKAVKIVKDEIAKRTAKKEDVEHGGEDVSEAKGKLAALKAKYIDPKTGRFKGGRGERFDNCVAYMKAKGGVKDPEGLCGSIARKKGLA